MHARSRSQLRFIENKAVVTGYLDAASGPATGLKLGDVVDRDRWRRGDGARQAMAPYYAASNEPTRLRDIAQSMTRGDCGLGGADATRATAKAAS